MLVLNVRGMDCQHCVDTVTRAVAAVPGSGAVVVDLAAGTVRVDGEADAAALRAAIARAGYDVV